jgi:cytochrome b561
MTSFNQATQPMRDGVLATAAHADLPARHPALTKALHWGGALALAVAVGSMFWRDQLEGSHDRLLLLQLHRQLGLLILVTAVWRTGRFLIAGLPDNAPELGPLLRWAARGTHLLLFAALIALPAIGWAMSGAHGVHLRLLGVLPLPQLVHADPELADTLADVHVWLAWSLLALASAHTLAALWHHFVLRDQVLAAMLPRWRRRAQGVHRSGCSGFARGGLNSERPGAGTD